MKRLVFIYLFLVNFMFAQNELKHEVYFNTGEHIVPEIEQNRLLLFIRDIEYNDIEKISIYGFCDDRGSDAYNLDLSQQRADAIRSVFLEYSRHKSIITNVDGKGEVLLIKIKSDNTDIIRGLNRKAEIIARTKFEDKVIEKEIASEIENNDTPSILKGELKVGDKVLLENILFESGNSTVIPESLEDLDKIAMVLVEKEHLYFTIQGHVCCTINTRDALDTTTNKRNLSLVRAKYIYDYLAKKGVDKKRMKYVGLRRRFPLGGDPKYDRRVEVLITYIGQNK